jgi:ferredoxin-NADP reductase
MSMLRAMRDRREGRRVLLIYANRDESNIVFRRELEALEAGAAPLLKTVHVLSRPPARWAGRSGRLDLEMLRTICFGFADKEFFVCCPPGMAKELIRGLRSAGVEARRIHADYFGL